ncbi:MAG: hypothetical protein JSV64_05395 [Candidatus Bathyarchaeota archaeon]|nr:MAG: hypothetical protein JSV64_05395 [Candidatus Bathyarchaeota archaeon]
MKVPIEISELRKNADGDTIKELADFVESKLQSVEVEMTGSAVILSSEEETLPRSYVRTLLRKFLHRTELGDFKVIAGKEGAFIIKLRKIATQE